MKMEKWRDQQNNNAYFFDHHNQLLRDCYDREVPSRERSPTIPSSGSSSPPTKLGHIEHHVSKFDTLVGIAIKYGVEVLFFLKKKIKNSFLCFILLYMSLVLIV